MGMNIDSYSFGRFVIDRKVYEHDIKIINGRIVFWQNHHLSIEDIKDAINAKPKPSTIIIGTGASGVVEVSQDIIDEIKKANIKLIIEMTGKACQTYNKLSKKENVAAILHSTC